MNYHRRFTEVWEMYLHPEDHPKTFNNVRNFIDELVAEQRLSAFREGKEIGKEMERAALIEKVEGMKLTELFGISLNKQERAYNLALDEVLTWLKLRHGAERFAKGHGEAMQKLTQK